MVKKSTVRAVAVSLALDLAIIAVFVVEGRRTHQGGLAPGDITRTLAPFLMALGLAWFIARVWESPTHPQTGAIIWAITLFAGMFTRRVMFGEGIAVTFIVVTALFLAAGFIGWRLVAAAASRFVQPAA